MKKLVMAAAVAAMGMPVSALADTVEARLQALEARLMQMESRLGDQARELKEKDARIAELEQRPAIAPAAASATASGGERPWFERVEFSGLMQIDAKHASPENGDDTSDVTAHKLELGMEADINDWVRADLLLKYEEDTDNDGEVEFENVRLTIADPNGPWFVEAGQYVLPFGVFTSYMLSDPITKELGETLDSALQVGVTNGMFTGSIYTFQGDRQDTLTNFGASASVNLESESATLSAQLSYLNDLAESNAIVDGGWVSAGADKVGAWVLSAELGVGDLHFVAEYLAAMDEFADAGGDKPRVYNLEAAYDFAAMGKDAYVALGIQGARDAEHAVWELPEKRVLGTVAMEVVKDTWLGLELKRDKDFAGDKETTLTGRVSVEF